MSEYLLIGGTHDGERIELGIDPPRDILLAPYEGVSWEFPPWRTDLVYRRTKTEVYVRKEWISTRMERNLFNRKEQVTEQRFFYALNPLTEMDAMDLLMYNYKRL